MKRVLVNSTSNSQMLYNHATINSVKHKKKLTKNVGALSKLHDSGTLHQSHPSENKNTTPSDLNRYKIGSVGKIHSAQLGDKDRNRQQVLANTYNRNSVIKESK